MTIIFPFEFVSYSEARRLLEEIRYFDLENV